MRPLQKAFLKLYVHTMLSGLSIWTFKPAQVSRQKQAKETYKLETLLIYCKHSHTFHHKKNLGFAVG